MAAVKKLTPEQQQLVLDHMEIAREIAMATRVPITRDERVSAGNLALCRAAIAWNERSGLFERYLVVAIRGDVIKEANYIRYGRQRGRKAQLVPRQFGDDMAYEIHCDGPADRAIRSEEYQLLRSATEGLLAPFRQVAQMTCDGLKACEISRKMSESRQTTSYRLSVIRKMLKQAISCR